MVLLPLPDSPTRPTISPLKTLKDTSLTASNFSESDYSRNKLKKLIIELSKNIFLANKE